MSSPKTTPVMEDPLDFPGVKNMEVCMFEIEIAYPAGQDALYDMIEGCTRRPKSQIKVVSDHFAQSYEENEGADPEEAPILEKEYDEQSKEAGEAYADPAKVVPETPTRFKIAGGDTPKAQTTNDLPMGDKSAMGSVKPKLPNVKSFAR